MNDFGEIGRKEWKQTEKIRENIIIDEFVVMPNHLHGIITIQWQWCKGTMHRAPTDKKSNVEKFGKPTSNSVPTIVRSYKAAVTRQINQINKQPGDKIWQRNYFERVIRNDTELEEIRKYIRENPSNWSKDKLNI
ncbi:transposase [Aliifodinibius sp. S!AR15-10]|uniref:transposase n=1 Tax=Aliifodinibius sp. S!AR15-10 TaxID=2950437 RepID=UPI00285D1BC5|nr:transposase [Aliifodinibius sp. S!AR15-10]